MRAVFIAPAVLALALIQQPARAAGQDTGNGEGLCWDKNSTSKAPCSLVLEQLDYKLPYTEDQKISLESFSPETRAELSSMLRLIANRGGTNLEATIKHHAVQLYNTKTFFGFDLQYVGEGLERQQVAFAFTYSALDENDLGRKRTFRVMELDLDAIRPLSPRHQAYILFHEYLHVFSDVDHAVMWPLFKTLDKALAIRDEQVRGNKRVLSPQELQVSETLQRLLAHLKGAQDSSHYRLHPNGGGVIWLIDPKNTGVISSSNFVGIDSSINWIEPGDAYYLDGVTVQDSVFKAPAAPERISFFAESEGALGAETGTAGASRDSSINVAAGTKPFRYCDRFDGEGRCSKAIYLLPVEFEARIGDKVEIGRARLSIVEWRTIDGAGRSTGSCSIHLGSIHVEGYRGDLGSVLLLSPTRANCELGAYSSNGTVGIRSSFNIEGTAFLPGGGKVDSPYFNTEDFGAGLLFEMGLGVELFKKIVLSAQGSLLELGGRRPGHDLDWFDMKFDLKLRVALTDKLAAEAYYTGNRTRITTKADEGDAREKILNTRIFGIGLSGRHNFLGPFPRSKRR